MGGIDPSERIGAAMAEVAGIVAGGCARGVALGEAFVTVLTSRNLKACGAAALGADAK